MDSRTIALPAYAQWIGVELDSWDGELPVLGINYQNAICGNPGMFHGGVVGALLEMAAVAALDAHLGAKGGMSKLVVLNATVEFLRTAVEQRAFASARIIRAGRRLATVQATLWQDSPEKPVSTAIVNILLAPVDG
jgi:uncharacterized protein (TIGR00369 family)